MEPGPSAPQAASPPNPPPARVPLGCKACNGSLEQERQYHKRFRVCKACSLLDEVLFNGAVHRFCQQCGTFHPIEAFQAGQRSCREQLTLHAARRRRRRRQKAGKPVSTDSEAGMSSGGGEGYQAGANYHGMGGGFGHQAGSLDLPSMERQYQNSQEKHRKRQRHVASDDMAGLGLQLGLHHSHSSLQSALHHLAHPHMYPAGNGGGPGSLLHLGPPLPPQPHMQHPHMQPPIWLPPQHTQHAQHEGQAGTSAQHRLHMPQPLDRGGPPSLGWQPSGGGGGMPGAGRAEEGRHSGRGSYPAPPPPSAPNPAPLSGGSPEENRSMGLKLVQVGLSLMGADAAPLSAALAAALGSMPDVSPAAPWQPQQQPPQQPQHPQQPYASAPGAGFDYRQPLNQQQQRSRPSFEHLPALHGGGGAAEPPPPAAPSPADIMAAVVAALSPQTGQGRQRELHPQQQQQQTSPQPPQQPPQQPIQQQPHQQQQQHQPEQPAVDASSMLEVVQMLLGQAQQAEQQQQQQRAAPAPAPHPPPLLLSAPVLSAPVHPQHAPAGPAVVLPPSAAEQAQGQAPAGQPAAAAAALGDPSQALMSMLQEMAGALR